MVGMGMVVATGAMAEVGTAGADRVMDLVRETRAKEETCTSVSFSLDLGDLAGLEVVLPVAEEAVGLLGVKVEKGSHRMDWGLSSSVPARSSRQTSIGNPTNAGG